MTTPPQPTADHDEQAAPPFFTRRDDAYEPDRIAVGPWGSGTINGRLLGGLAAHVLEQAHCPPGMRPARYHVDLLRLAALEPLHVDTVTVHAGRRSHVASATITQDDRTVARASAVFLRPGEEPGGEVWAADATMPPPPPAFPAAPDLSVAMVPFDDSGQPARDLGAWRSPTRRCTWLRENRALVGGEPLTPFVRTALAADVTSPMLNWSSTGLDFINTDYTVHLARLPAGPDLGLAGVGRHSSDGISASYARMHDRDGPFAVCSTTALANAVPFALKE